MCGNVMPKSIVLLSDRSIACLDQEFDDLAHSEVTLKVFSASLRVLASRKHLYKLVQ